MASTEQIGHTFQQKTKYFRENLPRGALNWAKKPEPYKVYRDAPRIKLESPRSKGGLSLWATLAARRTVRHFSHEPISLRELSQMLWAAQGITHTDGEMTFRTAPSAGALYPIETYVAVHRGSGIEPGLYHYAVPDRALEQLTVGMLAGQIAEAALGQRVAYDASAVFIWSAIFERSTWKYRERAYRYIYLDAGHIAQNVALAATALGLGNCPIGALFDDELNTLLGLDGDAESVVYMMAIGRPAVRVGSANR